MTEPGWYGEPGNAALERYWDGAQWTPQTRASLEDLRRQVATPAPMPAHQSKPDSTRAKLVAGAFALVVAGVIAWAAVAWNSNPDTSPSCDKTCQGSQIAAAQSYLNSASAAVAHVPLVTPPPAGPSYSADTPTVVYLLTGSAVTADLTLTDGGGGTSQQSGVDVPLTNQSGTPGIQFTAIAGQPLYFSAQNTGDGTLTCTIESNGVVVDTETSSGAYTIVTCQGTA